MPFDTNPTDVLLVLFIFFIPHLLFFVLDPPLKPRTKNLLPPFPPHGRYALPCALGDASIPWHDFVIVAPAPPPPNKKTVNLPLAYACDATRGHVVADSGSLLVKPRHGCRGVPISALGTGRDWPTQMNFLVACELANAIKYSRCVITYSLLLMQHSEGHKSDVLNEALHVHTITSNRHKHRRHTHQAKHLKLVSLAPPAYINKQSSTGRIQ